MEKNFEVALDDFINDWVKKVDIDEIISALELKLMALNEDG